MENPSDVCVRNQAARRFYVSRGERPKIKKATFEDKVFSARDVCPESRSSECRPIRVPAFPRSPSRALAIEPGRIYSVMILSNIINRIQLPGPAMSSCWGMQL